MRHPRQPPRNDPMSYIPDVIQRNGRSRMPCISIRMPAKLLAELDAEARKSGCSTSDIVRQLLKWALDVRHRGKLPLDPYV
jgi:Ribbon-helix-helix protein, copG family